MTRSPYGKGVNIFKTYTRLDAGLGALGTGMNIVRIAKARETKIVAGGMVGCYTAMVLGAPVAAKIGLAVSTLASLAAGVKVGGLVEFGFAGSIGGEYISEMLVGQEGTNDDK